MVTTSTVVVDDAQNTSIRVSANATPPPAIVPNLAYKSGAASANSNSINSSSNNNTTTKAPIAPTPAPVITSTTSLPISNKAQSTTTATTSITVKNDDVICTKVSGGIEGQIEESINSVRTSHGLQKVVACKELRAAANAKYQDIVLQNNFTHSWAGGQVLQNVIRSHGYNPKDWGEILVEGSDFASGSDYVAEWMTSPSHATIILTPKYTHVGVAVGAWTDEGVGVSIGVAEFGEAK